MGNVRLLATWRQRLQRLLDLEGDAIIRGGLKGVEKESLRVTPDGKVSQAPHPPALGSALTHPSITTDYSESLLEFITPPCADLRDTLRSLTEIHAFVYRHLGDEILWASSMPCIIGGDASIPIAEYGHSNIGRMKHVYRQGLDYRYGRSMQAISGVHFNFSLPATFWPALARLENDPRSPGEVKSDGYFRLIRNFQRCAWIVPYLFGASPAVCKSFLKGREVEFDDLDAFTYYLPYATSLRMSDIGYKNKAQAGLKVSYDSLGAYVESLGRAINTPDAEYGAIGTQVDGQWRQLNGNILQIEAEYYSFIRPKPIIHSGEKPTLALRQRGVEYVEMRALDVNAFEHIGVEESALRFMEALLIVCLLEESPAVSDQEQREIDHNQSLVARQGREPGLRLLRAGAEVPLAEWGAALCEAALAVAEVLDGGDPSRPYQSAVTRQQAALLDPDLTPSARILAELAGKRQSFVSFAMRISQQHARYFQQLQLSPEREAEFEAAAAESIARQRQLEASDTLSFDEFLRQYFAQA